MRFDPDRARADEDMRVSGAICKALLLARGNLHNAVAYAQTKMRDQFAGRDAERVFEEATDVTLLTRSAIGATASPVTTSPTSVLMTRMIAASVLAQLPRARRVPFRSTGKALLVGGAAAWVTPGQAIPVARSEFANLAHDPRTVGAIAVYTSASAEDVTGSDTAFADELTALLFEAINTKVTSSDAPTAAAPAGLAFGATAVASSGSTPAAIAKDFSDAVRIIADAGYVADAAFMSPAAATFVRLMKIADASGETIGGLRIITGPGVQGVTLVDSSRIAVSLGDRVVLGVSAEGDLEMSDAPTADSTAPTAAGTNMINLFATNSQALRGLAAVNASVVAASDSGGSLGVVSLTGASYD